MSIMFSLYIFFLQLAFALHYALHLSVACSYVFIYKGSFIPLSEFFFNYVEHFVCFLYFLLSQRVPQWEKNICLFVLVHIAAAHVKEIFYRGFFKKYTTPNYRLCCKMLPSSIPSLPRESWLAGTSAHVAWNTDCLISFFLEQNGLWYGIPCSPPAGSTLCVLRCSVPHHKGLWHLYTYFKSSLKSKQLSIIDKGPRSCLSSDSRWPRCSLQLSWGWLRVRFMETLGGILKSLFSSISDGSVYLCLIHIFTSKKTFNCVSKFGGSELF